MNNPAYMTKVMIGEEESNQKDFIDIHDYETFTETLYDCCEWFYNTLLMITMERTRDSLKDDDISLILNMNKEIEKAVSKKFDSKYLIENCWGSNSQLLICKVEPILHKKYNDSLDRLYYTVRISPVFPGDKSKKIIVKGFRGIENAYSDYFDETVDKLMNIIHENRYTREDIGSGPVYMDIDMPIQRFFKTVTVEPFIM
mgnify:CR=1 FL=1